MIPAKCIKFLMSTSLPRKESLRPFGVIQLYYVEDLGVGCWFDLFWVPFHNFKQNNILMKILEWEFSKERRVEE